MGRENRETFSFFKVQAAQFKMVGKFRNIYLLTLSSASQDGKKIEKHLDFNFKQCKSRWVGK